jgi:PAS domain S-box-containing protein
MLEVVRAANLTVWAADGADQDHAIRLWSPGAERVYGHTREEALGRSYLDLFVNPKEQARAVEDHERLTRTGEVYEWDWAADDLDARGRVRTMITNCFRVWDQSRGKWLLAEVGIDVSDLDRASQRLRRVQELSLVQDYARKHVQSMKAISDIGQAIAELGDEGPLGAVVRAIFEGVRRVVSGKPTSHLWLFTGAPAAEYEDDTPAAFPFGQEAAIALMEREMRPLFHDPARPTGALADLSLTDERSFALLPLIEGVDPGELFGLLALVFADDRTITAEDEESLLVFATQVGTLLMIATELQRRRKEAARRVQDETKELVIRSVLHTVGNDAYTLQGRTQQLIEDAETIGVPRAFSVRLGEFQAAAEQLGSSMRELRERLARSSQAETLPLVEPVEAVVQPLLLHHNQVEVRVAIDRDLLVCAARSYVRHAFSNVISNGVQILEESDGGGLIDVWARRVDDWIELHVEDDGPGVDPAICNNLFSDGVTRRKGGSGQGLYMARDLIATCGGAIELVPVSRHGGAHFKITLPACAPAEGAR